MKERFFIYQNIYIQTTPHRTTLDLQFLFDWYVGSASLKYNEVLTTEMLYTNKNFRPNQHSKEFPAFQSILQLDIPDNSLLTSYEEDLRCWVKEDKIPALIKKQPNLAGLIKTSNKKCASVSRIPVNFDFDKESRNLRTDCGESLDVFFDKMYDQCYGDVNYNDITNSFIEEAIETYENTQSNPYEYQY